AARARAGGSGEPPRRLAPAPQAPPAGAPPTLTPNPNSRGRPTPHWPHSTPPGVTQNGIYRRTSSGSYTATPTATIGATTSYQDSGLASGTTYCYVVTTFGSGGESARSNESCDSPR